MRVLIVHDRYEETLPNGENAMVDWEAASLSARGVATRMLQTPAAVLSQPLWKRGLEHLGGMYSISNRGRVRRAIAEFQPDLAHVHNLWPHMTPSVYHACREAKVPVVQTLHNYRILCIADFLCRDAKICELCLPKTFAWPGVRHRCCQGSAGMSLVKMAAVGAHKAWGAWRRLVNLFIAPSESMRAKFIEGGFTPDRIRVKPSCSPDAGVSHRDRQYFCFAGRLSQEKGVQLLLEVWKQPGMPPLRIAGTGPLETAVRQAAKANPAVRYLGMLPREEVFELMGGAIATLVPSAWEEPSPVVLIQSLSVGTPVIASDLGHRAETVPHGEIGLVFPDRDGKELERLVRWAAAAPQECRRMGLAGRRRYEELYSLDACHARLLEIYREAMQR